MPKPSVLEYLLSAFHNHLWLVSQIRRHVSQEVTARLILALVISWLDYCNAVLAGLPQSTVAHYTEFRTLCLASSSSWSPATMSLLVCCSCIGMSCCVVHSESFMERVQCICRTLSSPSVLAGHVGTHSFAIVNWIHGAMAANKVLWTCVLTRRSLSMECTASGFVRRDRSSGV